MFRWLLNRFGSPPNYVIGNPLDADVWATMKAQRDKAIAKAERLEAQNARLRELVREAWDEGFEVGDVGNPRRSGWAMSKVKAALDALDKEETP